MQKKLAVLFSVIVAAASAVAFAYTGRAATTTTQSANPGIVVIETNLGYQGGQAAGTGMVLTPSGEVLTNNHVIAGATAIKVIVPSTGRSYTAQVLGYSVTKDTAVLKLENASGLATVTTGNSSTLKLGQFVRATGNALGSGRLTTVTGRITGLGRTITATDGQSSEQLSGLVETSTPIQPGDSGGPLLDGSRKVQGMNTAASRAGGFYFQDTTNDAYAIPINAVLKVVKQVESGSSSSTVHIGATAFLGVQIAPGDGMGAVIRGVVSSSPADTAGLQYGDVITALDGHAISSPNALRALLLQKHPGDTTTLTWVDGSGTRHNATVTLASGPPQ
jgi:S1-C subfamily serine protease